jgi:hypothetical protein
MRYINNAHMQLLCTIKKMTLRILIILFLGLTIISCNSTNSKNEPAELEQTQNTEPNYQVAIQFINDYLDYSNDLKSEIRLIEWVNKRNDVTTEFKNELKRILDEAEKNDPELGLGFDPILDAQDNPNKFEIDKVASEYLVVKGLEWSEFQLTLKLKYDGNKWLVDGSGIINVPENKRIKK